MNVTIRHREENIGSPPRRLYTVDAIILFTDLEYKAILARRLSDTILYERMRYTGANAGTTCPVKVKDAFEEFVSNSFLNVIEARNWEQELLNTIFPSLKAHIFINLSRDSETSKTHNI